MFRVTNKYDRHQNYWDTNELPGEKPYVLAMNSELEGSKAWYVSKGTYIFLSMICFGWI